MFRVTEMMTVTLLLTDKYLSTFRRNHVPPRSGPNISGESTIFETSVNIYQLTRNKILWIRSFDLFRDQRVAIVSWASTVSSPSRFVAEGVFRKSCVVHSFELVDSVLFVFGSHILYSSDL